MFNTMQNMDVSKWMKMWNDNMNMFNKSTDMLKSMNVYNNMENWMKMWNFQQNNKSNQDLFNFDMESAMNIMFQNMETLSEINQLANENNQALLRRKAEIVQKNVTELFDLMKEISTSPNPEVTISKQVEYIRNSVNKVMGDTQELTEICNKSNMEAFEKLSNIISSNMNKLSDKNTSKKTAKAS